MECSSKQTCSLLVTGGKPLNWPLRSLPPRRIGAALFLYLQCQLAFERNLGKFSIMHTCACGSPATLTRPHTQRSRAYLLSLVSSVFGQDCICEAADVMPFAAASPRSGRYKGLVSAARLTLISPSREPIPLPRSLIPEGLALGVVGHIRELAGRFCFEA